MKNRRRDKVKVYPFFTYEEQQEGPGEILTFSYLWKTGGGIRWEFNPFLAIKNEKETRWECNPFLPKKDKRRDRMRVIPFLPLKSRRKQVRV